MAITGHNSPRQFPKEGRSVISGGAQTTPLLYPTGKPEPLYLSDDFLSTCSWRPRLGILTKYKTKQIVSYFISFIASPIPLNTYRNSINCNVLMTRLLENFCRSPPILGMMCRNILAIEQIYRI
ncbi:hypothetical protein AVEN_36692-1 [Araneus ventricosus]|uniref:Uncharacterized protein n=1 Tax=Araneus ventricosus TaxID=182803 RepID=A0A4Y2TGS2_ARAVE|nr:hypothetical protein AVEN_5045-1 [Araneus ventricosus]GBN98315.1 hypothetical protein AVEN_36692-1 [Araneus ventricosus]